MIEEFNIGDTVVITSSCIDHIPAFQKLSKIGKIKLIDKSCSFPYYVYLPDSDVTVWSNIRTLTLLERELHEL